MNKKRTILTLAAAVVLTLVVCLGLYRFDNKYTQTQLQPINGVLFYDEPQLCYLTRQWVTYPDVLLTPDTAADYDGYRTYSDIGGKAESSKGQVTYALTLLLPETPAAYALELPEVYSSCRLYINGRQMLQLGDPELGRSAMATRTVTFTGAGETQLLLAASDASGLGRGLTYPPAFGPAEAVLAAGEARLLLHGAAVLLCLLGALLAISFSLRTAALRGLLTCLMCLALAVVTGYPLYHRLFVTAAQPWYTIEPGCYYSVLLLALLLYGDIFGLEKKWRFLLSLPCAAGLALCLLRFGAAAVLPPVSARLFSLAADAAKYYTALCLLVMAVMASLRGRCRSSLLLCGSAALAVCLLCDRALPLYEPVLGGWFGEIGGFILVCCLSSALWLDALDAYRFRLTYEESYHQMEQRLQLQKDHYSQLSRQVRLAREAGHDLRHHMRTMRALAEEQHWEKLEQYLQEYETHIQERQVTVWSDHLTADAILNYYASRAAALNAVYDVRLAIPPELPFPDDELCILLSNLLENATDALSSQQNGVKKLYLRGEVSGGHLGIVVDNTYDAPVLEHGGSYLSTKHPGHGLGIGSVQTIVSKYNGLADFSADNGVFHVSLFIPLPH